MSHTKIEYGAVNSYKMDVDIEICEECSEANPFKVVEWPCPAVEGTK